ncbi:MDR family MFS transporter [Streptomyces sp. 900116325]
MPTIKAPGLDRGLIVIAAVLLAGAVASLLDTTIVSVALTSIARDFGASEKTFQWVSTAYLLTLALVTPLVGWSVDRFGAKPMWMFSITLFLLGSVLCGTAWSITSLVAFRIVKGIGGGMILPLCQAILAQAAGPQRFGRVMSLIALPAQLAPIVGPVLGGIIIDGLGWRWIFFVNVPICIVALLLAWRILPAPGGRHDVPVDRLGLLLLPPSLGLLVYGFSRFHDTAGFTNPVTMLVLFAGIALLGGFTIHALRTTNPLLDLRLFSSRTFSASSVLIFLHGVAVYGPLFLLPLYYARTRGYDAGSIGWLLAPQGLGTLLAIAFAGVLADRFGSRPLVLWGTAATALGTVAFTQLLAVPDDILLSVSLFVRGLGLGFVGVAITAGAYRDISATAIARATGMISVVQRLGASFGTALIAVILAIELPNASASPGTRHIASAYGNTFWWMLTFTLINFIPVAVLPRPRSKHPPLKLSGSAQPADTDPTRESGPLA